MGRHALALGPFASLHRDRRALREGLVDLELRHRDDGSCLVDPWPFAAAPVRVHCEARRLDGAPRSARAARGLAVARPVRLEYVLEPA